MDSCRDALLDSFYGEGRAKEAALQRYFAPITVMIMALVSPDPFAEEKLEEIVWAGTNECKSNITNIEIFIRNTQRLMQTYVLAVAVPSIWEVIGFVGSVAATGAKAREQSDFSRQYSLTPVSIGKTGPNR